MTMPTFPEEIVQVAMPRSLLEKRIPRPCVARVLGPDNVMPTWDRWFRRFTYKPGYDLMILHPEAHTMEDGIALFGSLLPYSHFYLKAYVPNATTELHEPYLLQFQAIIPHHLENHGDAAQQDFLRNVLRTFETHEMEEWMRIDGQEVYAPHASEIR